MPTETTHRLVPTRKTPLTRRLAVLVNEHHNGSVYQMAAALGCDRVSLWRLCNGRTKEPGLALLMQIAKHHGLTLDQLVK